jgi:hypothetical protein
MAIDLTPWGLGTVSLFPLAAELDKLRGWFPADRRTWFVTFSTLFSAIVYVLVVFNFDDIEYIPIPLTLLLALALLSAYVLIHLALRRKYATMRSGWYAVTIVGLLLLYIFAVAAITYSFNAAVKLREYSVVRGRALKPDGTSLCGADVIVYFRDGSKMETVTGWFGYFAVPMKKANASKVAGLGITERDSQGVITHSSTWARDEFPISKYFTKYVQPMQGSP